MLRGPGAFEKVHFFKRRAVFYAHLERRVGWFCLAGFYFPARQGPQSGRWRQAVSWRLCRLETARALWVLCRLMGGCLVGEPIFLLWGSGMFLPCSWFFAYPAGAKTLFLLQRKRKSGSGLRKRKGRPVEIMGRCDTTAQSTNPAWLSLG